MSSMSFRPALRRIGMVFNNGSLVVHVVSEEDSGMYTLAVFNKDFKMKSLCGILWFWPPMPGCGLLFHTLNCQTGLCLLSPLVHRVPIMGFGHLLQNNMQWTYKLQ